jgi:hypothetical protein
MQIHREHSATAPRFLLSWRLALIERLMLRTPHGLRRLILCRMPLLLLRDFVQPLFHLCDLRLSLGLLVLQRINDSPQLI